MILIYCLMAASVSTWMGDCISMSISGDSLSDQTLNPCPWRSSCGDSMSMNFPLGGLIQDNFHFLSLFLEDSQPSLVFAGIFFMSVFLYSISLYEFQSLIATVHFLRTTIQKILYKFTSLVFGTLSSNITSQKGHFSKAEM